MGLWGASAQERVRQPAVADLFYPGEPQRLAQMVDQLLAEAPAASFEGELVALLVPHAGYDFSGAVAASALNALHGHPFDVVILVGVAHRTPLEGAAVYPGGAFATPLGRMPIDREAVAWLTRQTPLIRASEPPHLGEHSLEVELPFLQRLLGEFQLVPLVMGNPELTACQAIGEALAALVTRYTHAGKRCLLLASSDLSHYPTEQDAHRVDQQSLAAVVSGEAAEVDRVSVALMAQDTPNLLCTFCGEGAVKTVMLAARALGASRVTQLRYATSADVPQGEADRVVGYAAVAFSRLTSPAQDAATPMAEEAAPAWQGESPRLLRLARQAVVAYVTTRERPSERSDPSWPAALAEPAAVFITLRRGEELRGCIGTTEPRWSLGVAVQHYAIAAATEDTRFLPVSAEELKQLTLEVSVLSPLRRVSDPSEIQPQVHGVVVTRGNRSGVFLPQVWEETGWSREEFLRQLCAQKAGLSPDAWHDPATELYVFTVHSFSE